NSIRSSSLFVMRWTLRMFVSPVFAVIISQSLPSKRRELIYWDCITTQSIFRPEHHENLGNFTEMDSVAALINILKILPMRASLRIPILRRECFRKLAGVYAEKRNI